MSPHQIQGFYVTNKSTAFLTVTLVLGKEVTIPLAPDTSIRPSTEQFLDLVRVDGLNVGDTFKVRVNVAHGGPPADSDTVLTYVATSADGISRKYTVEGTPTALEIHDFETPGPADKPTGNDTQVRSLRVFNNTPALAVVILVLSNGTAIPLDSQHNIHPNEEQNIVIVGEALGINDGDTFTIRVRIPHSGQVADDDTVLTYVDSVYTCAKYSIQGTATAPSIIYSGSA